MWKCSYCGKENANESPSCAGCGKPSPHSTRQAQLAHALTPEAYAKRARGRSLMWQGAFWFFGGACVTLVTYAAAIRSPGGGEYVVATGALVFGLAQFFRGRAMAKGTDAEIEAQELLELAAEFERLDRSKAKSLYEEILERFPRTRAASEARRNLRAIKHAGKQTRHFLATTRDTSIRLADLNCSHAVEQCLGARRSRRFAVKNSRSA